MKKVLATVAAASIVAAGAPAFAADVDLSGEVRVRYENKNNFKDFNDDAGDLSNDTSQRTRLSATVKVDDQTTAKITLNDARTWASEAKTDANGNNVDLNEGYLQINNAIGPVSIKAGRQALAYGNQRLIGSLEWADQSRRFDALKLTYASEVVDVDVVSAKTALGEGPVDAKGNPTPASDDQLNIVYATIKNVIPANTLDAYLIQKIGGHGDYTNFNTVGVRLAGKAAGADWTAEVANQAGDAATDGVDQEASAMAITAGYTLSNVLGGLRIGGEVFSATGDDGTDASTSENFDHLYPTNHYHFGIADIMNDWSNITGSAIKISAKPAAGLTVKAEIWAMEEVEGGALGENELTEMNVQVKYGLTEKTQLYVYYAMVSYDPADTTENDDDATKLGIQLSAKF